jgi:hypothetical protein
MPFTQVINNGVPWCVLANVFTRRAIALGEYDVLIAKQKTDQDVTIGFIYFNGNKHYYLFWAGSEKVMAINADKFKWGRVN